MRRLVLFPLIIFTALALAFFSFATSDAERGKGDDKSSTPTPSKELSGPSATPSSNPLQSLSPQSRTVTPVPILPTPVPTATPSVTAVPVLTATPGVVSVPKAEGISPSASLAQIVLLWTPAVAAILTVFLLGLQWQTLKEQKDVQVANERAWIMISQGKNTFAWSPTTRLEFKPNIINKGKSPANITKVRGEFLLLSKQDFECLWTEKPEPEYPPPNPDDRLTLFPDDSFTRSFFIERPVDRNDSDAISTGDLVLFFRARVDYEDAFGKRRFTTAAYRWVPTTMPPSQGFRQAGPPAYNRAV